MLNYTTQQYLSMLIHNLGKHTPGQLMASHIVAKYHVFTMRYFW